MCRLTLSLLLSFFIFALNAEQLAISVHAESAILMNAETGAVLYEKNSRKLQFPASTTKIATAAYTLKVASEKLEDKISADQEAIASISEQAKKKSNYTLPPYWIEQGSTHMGIKKGEIFSLKDLLYGLMVASANDSANVIAQHVGGTIPDFMKGVNNYLQEIGAKDTVFMNPHGLHHPKHQTTAYDMAILAIDAMKDPLFRQIASTVHFTRPKTNKQEPTTLVQGNRLLKKGQYHYAKAIGIKTGYTSVAQHNLVAAAKDGDRTLVAVLLKNPEKGEMFKDAAKMFEAAFNQPKVERVLLPSGKQKFVLDIPGADKKLYTVLQKDISTTYYPAEEPKIKALLFWDNLTLPIKKDQRVGEIRMVYEDGSVLTAQPIYAAEEVNKAWLGGILEGGLVKWSWILKIGAVFAVFFLLGKLWMSRR